mmetsp:Transcript_22110/g.46193  ORF Transcript_22110/g.46193 Transcript_22110/m.46193 type:complete len:289 (+) Transcript_22110:144-1010(+)
MAMRRTLYRLKGPGGFGEKDYRPTTSKINGLYKKEEEMETEMPWRGWVGRVLSDPRLLGPERYKKLADWLVFRPGDKHSGAGVPTSARTTMPGVERIKGYRYPAPGSRPPVSVPTVDSGPEGSDDSDPYNTGYYWRDTKRNTPNLHSLHIVGSGTPPGVVAAGAVKLTMRTEAVEGGEVKETVLSLHNPPQKDPETQMGSPGNKGVFATGPSPLLSDVDPTGLRAAMSTSWPALNAAVVARQPTQLVTYEWEGRQADVLREREEKGMGVYAGDGTKWRMPKKARQRSW